jgi:3-hydroxy acid dehydrogenase / malonic semialdehyde reductase
VCVAAAELFDSWYLAAMHTVFITGATGGIGEACMRAYRRDGHRVIALGRNANRLNALYTELGGSDWVLPLAVDVRDTKGLATAVASLPSAFAAVSILVNNAGLALGIAKAQDAVPEDWDTMIDTNVRGFMHVTRLLLPAMVARNAGHIVHMGSVAGSYPYAGGNVYGATKAFVEQFSLNLRADLAGTRVRVTNIEPGAVHTEFSTVRYKGDTEQAAKVYAGLEALTADDIADVVTYVTGLPERVNVNRLELMSIAQSFAGFTFQRG